MIFNLHFFDNRNNNFLHVFSNIVRIFLHFWNDIINLKLSLAAKNPPDWWQGLPGFAGSGIGLYRKTDYAVTSLIGSEKVVDFARRICYYRVEWHQDYEMKIRLILPWLPIVVCHIADLHPSPCCIQIFSGRTDDGGEAETLFDPKSRFQLWTSCSVLGE